MSHREFRIPILRAATWSQESLSEAFPDSFLDVAVGAPEVALIPSLLRRRLSPLGKGMLHCAGRVSEGMGELRSVFASQHGEPSRALPILSDLAQGLETSPTQFSMNVHNAIAGIWSIVRGDRSASTALAAGYETFGWGLLEAHALHQAHGGAPVLFVYGDDRLPELLTGYEPLQAPLHAIALMLGLPAQRTLVLQRGDSALRPSPDLPQSLHALQALGGAPLPQAWPGSSGTWNWRLEAP